MKLKEYVIHYQLPDEIRYAPKEPAAVPTARVRRRDRSAPKEPAAATGSAARGTSAGRLATSSRSAAEGTVGASQPAVSP